uniref:Uncharacterized protein n=1 Tax=Rangifer tarandus platyrhynchus TaxID=3082113 RepID=A0ACB0ERC8_RANTA|nr:unnamed protein product [Rangifer tarandus platyrhynchus]
MRAVRSAPHTARIKAVSQQSPLFSIPDLCALKTRSNDFSSRRTSPHTATHAHILSSLSPALPFALWGKAIGRNSSPSGKPPPPRTSPVPRLSRVPGLRRAREAGEVRGRTEERLRARCPPPSRRWSCSVQAGASAPALSRQVSADAGSETWRQVHLTATPSQLQPLDPAPKCCGQSPTQPSRCSSRHHGLDAGESPLSPCPRALARSPPRRCELRHRTPAS